MCDTPTLTIPGETVSAHAASFCLPDELCISPHVHVALSGLDSSAAAGSDSVDRRVIDALMACRGALSAKNGAQNSPSVGGSPVSSAGVHYSFLEADHKFPASKPPRTSYDWLQPRGILKRGWMRKHLYGIPAVVVVFFQLEWLDSDWTRRMQLCSSRLQAVRAALGTHVTRLALVLVQQQDPPTTTTTTSGTANGELLATHRLAELCATCDLNTKSLLVLPVNQNLSKHAARLETVLLELAFTYYQHRVKMAHGSRELLSAAHHQKLFVRQQFKIGFFSEIKQDWNAAHKAYDQSFTHLLELPVDDWQVLCVAALISYKVCRLAFARNLPRDAVGHFRRHIDLLLVASGAAGVYSRFAESSASSATPEPTDSPLCRAWLSQQYVWFAELFSRAVQHGLSALPQQNPGVYYQLAALHARHRRLQAMVTSSKLAGLEYPSPDPLCDLGRGEFIGEYSYPSPLQYNRDFVVSSSSTALASSSSLGSSQLAVHMLESHAVPHCTLVIPLLSAAVSHHKRQRCQRRAARLTTLMADEYAVSGEHGKAVVLLQKVLPIYWSECWWQLITQLTTSALYSCFIEALVAPYVLMSSVLLSQPKPDGDDAVFGQMFRELDVNLFRILQRQHPLPLSVHSVDDSQLPVIADRWARQLSSWSSDSALQVDMGRLRPRHSLIVSASASFAADRVQSVAESDSSTITVLVHVSSRSAYPVRVLAISATVERVASGGYRPPSAAASAGIDSVVQCSCAAGVGEYSQRSSIVQLTPQSQESTVPLQLRVPSAADSSLILSSWHVTLTSAVGEDGDDGVSDPIPVCFSWKHTPGLSADLYKSSARIGSSPGQHTPSDVFHAAVILPVSRVKLQVQHTSPALLGELYQLSVHVDGLLPTPNDDISDPRSVPPLSGDVCLDVGPAYVLQTSEGGQSSWAVSEKVLLVTEEKSQTLSSPISVTFPDLSNVSNAEVPVVVQCLDMTPPTLQMALRYTECGHQFSVTDTVQIPVVQPFEAQLRLLNERFEMVEVVRPGDIVFLQCEITSSSPHHLTVHHTSILTEGTIFDSLDEESLDSDGFSANRAVANAVTTDADSRKCDSSSGCHQVSPLLSQCCLSAGQCVAECRTLRVKHTGVSRGSDGDRQGAVAATLTVHWMRRIEKPASGDAGSSSVYGDRVISPAISSTVLSLPAVQVALGSPPFTVSLCLPAVARVGVPVTARYRLKSDPANTGCWLLVQLEACEAFMAHGTVKTRVNLAPGQERELVYTLYPLIVGSSLLPRLRISLDQPPGSISSSAPSDTSHQQLLTAVEAATDKLVRQMYVLPEEKSVTSAEGVVDSLDRQLTLMCV